MRSSLLLVSVFVFLTACFSDDEAALRAEIETSTYKQELSVCGSSCPFPMNGQPVACASNYGCYADNSAAYCWTGYDWNTVQCSSCGNGVCQPEFGESYPSCSDCPNPNPIIECGNGICESGETAWSCAEDCPGTCGDGKCNYYYEDSWTCSTDCRRPPWDECNPYCP